MTAYKEISHHVTSETPELCESLFTLIVAVAGIMNNYISIIVYVILWVINKPDKVFLQSLPDNSGISPSTVDQSSTTQNDISTLLTNTPWPNTSILVIKSLNTSSTVVTELHTTSLGGASQFTTTYSVNNISESSLVSPELASFTEILSETDIKLFPVQTGTSETLISSHHYLSNFSTITQIPSSSSFFVEITVSATITDDPETSSWKSTTSATANIFQPSDLSTAVIVPLLSTSEINTQRVTDSTNKVSAIDEIEPSYSSLSTILDGILVSSVKTTAHTTDFPSPLPVEQTILLKSKNKPFHSSSERTKTFVESLVSVEQTIQSTSATEGLSITPTERTVVTSWIDESFFITGQNLNTMSLKGLSTSVRDSLGPIEATRLNSYSTIPSSDAISVLTNYTTTKPSLLINSSRLISSAVSTMFTEYNTYFTDLVSRTTQGSNYGLITSSRTYTTMQNTTLTSTISVDKTLMPSSSENYFSSLNNFRTDQITVVSGLSSFSSTFDLPVISTTYSSETTSLGSLRNYAESSEGIYSSEILTPTTTNVIEPSLKSFESSKLSTPEYTGVTSAYDKMSSSCTYPGVEQRLGDLEQQIEDLKDTENSYIIAVVVLVLIILALVALIVLYLIRRRRYHRRKELKLRGIDEDLLDSKEAKMRPHNKTYFDVNEPKDLRISGRISTASLGENEPLNVLESFNKSKKQNMDNTTEESDDGPKTYNIKDVNL